MTPPHINAQETSFEECELTVLMPCLNEKLTLAACIRKAKAFLARVGVRGEVLIADNGSDDGSPEIAISEGARVLRVFERGYGAALIAGTRAARGRYVIMGDSDDSYDFSELDLFLDALRNGSDLVMGDRFAGGIQPGAMPPLHKYLGNPVLSFLGRVFYRSSIRDFHCGLRGYRREAILSLDLRCTGMEYASEMVVKATLASLRIAQVPTILHPDGRDRPPHLRSWRDGWRHLKFLLLHAPAWLFFYPGVIALGVGMALLVMLAGGPLRGPASVLLDIHSMVYAMVFGIVGLQFILFSGMAYVHGAKMEVLPDPSTPVRKLINLPVEVWLIAALLLACAGVGLGVVALENWSRHGFGAIDPTVVMRWVIGSAACLLASGQLASGGFFFECMRIPAKVAAEPTPKFRQVALFTECTRSASHE